MANYYASFGSSKTSLATVQYAEMNGSTTVVAATTTGVVETGGGVYMVPVTLNASTTGILWDTGEGTPIYAFEDTKQDLTHKLLKNRKETNSITGVQTVYDDDGTTSLLTGNVYKDVGGNEAYNGTGIDRADALT